MSAGTVARPRARTAARRPAPGSRFPCAPWCVTHETLGLDELCWATVPVGGLEVRVLRFTDDEGHQDEASIYAPGGDGPVVELTPAQSYALAAALVSAGSLR